MLPFCGKASKQNTCNHTEPCQSMGKSFSLLQSDKYKKYKHNKGKDLCLCKERMGVWGEMKPLSVQVGVEGVENTEAN